MDVPFSSISTRLEPTAKARMLVTRAIQDWAWSLAIAGLGRRRFRPGALIETSSLGSAASRAG